MSVHVPCLALGATVKKVNQALAATKNNTAAHVTRHDQHDQIHDQIEVDRHAHW